MLRTLTVLGLSAVLASCASGPTPYQQVGDGRYGYTEQAIESDRYLVTFKGNSLTDRDTVETYLLFRAAELTLERGYDHFRLARRDTEANRRLVGSSHDRFSVHYRYFHPRYGWYGWRDPFWNDVNVREVTRYEAMAEIMFGRGAAPNHPDAFDAREVSRNLGPNVRLPEQA